jgi:hypothetical protein
VDREVARPRLALPGQQERGLEQRVAQQERAQTNVVRQDGHRGTLITILKAGNASTINVVKGIRDLLPRVAQTLPPELKIVPLADQSIFVRGAVSGVIREAVIAACLTGFTTLERKGRRANQAAIRAGNQSGKFYSPNGKSSSAGWRYRQASAASSIYVFGLALAMSLLTPRRADNLRQEK